MPSEGIVRASSRCASCGSLPPATAGRASEEPARDHHRSSDAQAEARDVASASVAACEKTSRGEERITKEMLRAGRRELIGFDPEIDSDEETLSRIYSAMLNAANAQGEL